MVSALVATMITAGLTACDSDSSSGSIGTATVLSDDDGNKIQVSHISGSDVNVYFDYDERGRLTNFGDYEVKGSKITLGDATDYGQYEITLSTNSLVSKVTYTYNEKESDGSYEKSNAVVNFTYSGGHFASATGTSTYLYYDASRNEKEESIGKVTMKATWSGGNLMKFTSKYTEQGVDDGERYSESWSEDYTMGYSGQANTFGQMPFYIASEIQGDGVLGALATVGLLGTGPKELPTGYVLEEIEDDDVETSAVTLGFKLNSNGSIRTETKNSSRTVTYTYNDVDTRAAGPEQLKAMALGVKSAFGKMHRHHRKQ